MTPREMTAEELERALGYLANGRNNSADLTFEAARVRAHIAALRARADAAVNAMADVTEAVLGERPVGVMRETTLEAVQALRARVETAEADNAALLMAGRHVYALAQHAEACAMLVGDDLNACNCAVHEWREAQAAAHPGGGYRAKVRAELLRELAAYHRDVSAKTWPMERKAHRDEAMRLEMQAVREEQG